MLLLTACSASSPGTDEADHTPASTDPSQTFEETATTGPTRVLFVAEDESGSAQVEALRSEFEGLAGQSGYSFERQNGLNPEDLDGTVRAVILLASIENAGELIAQNPEVGFFLTDADAITLTANIYPIALSQVGRDQVAFLAGFMAAVTTFDWRIGAVALSDTAGTADLEAFTAGARYFCGWCRPAYPPYLDYPQTLSASQSDSGGGLNAASSLNEAGVDTVFVPVDLATAEFLTPLAEAGLAIISSADPVSGLESQWMATIRMASTGGLQAVWEAMLAREPAPSSQSALEISHLNEALISSGRADRVRQVADELQSGFIDTGVSGVE
jgi:hypothetical protein